MHIKSSVKKVQAFDIFIYIFITIVGLTMLFPFWHTLVGSLMHYTEYIDKPAAIFTINPTLAVYEKILEDGRIWIPMINTVFITIAGTISTLFVCSYTAYGLSKRFYGGNIIMVIFIISMYLRAGLIPNYVLLKDLGLINNYLVYIIPVLILPFYVIIMRTSFQGMGEEVFESSKIDGCNEFGIFFRFALPLSKAMLAALGLFIAVFYWNTLFPSLFYITDPAKKTVQEYLYRIIQGSTFDDPLMDTGFPTETLRLGYIMVVILPIIMVYPFLQKYFVKGVMIGAVKG